MTSKLTRDKAQWLHDACEEAAAAGIKLTMNPNELLMFTSYVMDAMYSKPVAWTDEEELRDVNVAGIGYLFGIDRDANKFADPRRQIMLYRNAQPAPVVQCPFPCGWDNLNKLAIQDAELVARGLVEGELTTEAHRQAAISNNDRLLKVISSCSAAMLAAAQQSPGSEPDTVPGKWTPVSERLPEPNKFVLVSNGVWVGQGLYDDSEYLESDEHWQDEHREFINVLYHPVTHWMPLPAAPQGEKP